MPFELSVGRMGPALVLVGLAGLVIVAVVVDYISPEPALKMEEDRAADLREYAARLSGSGDPYFGTRQLDYLTGELESPLYDTDTWRLTILRQLAFHRLRLGQVDESITLLTEAVELAERSMPDSHDRLGALEELAVAYMKRGEIQNCVSPEGRLVCALPLDP
ncbi:MAG: tetratricopeptide repeat protein, partial [Dehalococcoidia bacterium]|nr:tetratricopeptide repeat protein [Dehalococcoidia bacterium]